TAPLAPARTPARASPSGGAARPVLDHIRGGGPIEAPTPKQFVADSALEGGGFKLQVRRCAPSTDSAALVARCLWSKRVNGWMGRPSRFVADSVPLGAMVRGRPSRRLGGLSGGDGFQLLVRPRKRGTFCVLAAKFMILSRSPGGRSTSLVSLETLREAG